MIIRHIAMKSNRLSSFSRLVKYITDEQNKQGRVGKITISNCHSIEPDWAIQEVLATQSKNQRATSDKTYHLLISFAPDESPQEDVLKAIEDRVISAIGFQEHQRISVIHHDTDNLHIHVAINKIHPRSFNIIEPYRAYKVFAKVATKLEIEYDLQVTNHQTRKSRSENLADDMERHSGIESLINWMQHNCKSQIDSANNWDELHHILGQHGLEIRIRANGLIFCNDRGLVIKASSVSRSFSKRNLESKLGQFKPSERHYETNNKNNYRYEPINKELISSTLYAQYCNEKERSKTLLSTKLKPFCIAKANLIEKTKKNYRVKRTALKLMTLSWQQKKYFYQQINRAQLQRIDKICQNYAVERKRLIDFHQNKTWVDWLRQKAEAGHEEALVALRYRMRKNRGYYALSGASSYTAIDDIKQVDSITKEGTTIYKLDKTVIRNDGEKIIISKGNSISSLKNAIEMARQCYGDCIRVSGSPLFQKIVLQIAVQHHIPIAFADAAMEDQRKQLILKQEINDEKSNKFNYGNRTARGNEIIGTTLGQTSSQRRNRFKAKSNAFGIRQIPPAEGQNGLRNVSQLDVVQLTGRSKVLLQNHAHDQLELQGRKSDHYVRRKVVRLR